MDWIFNFQESQTMGTGVKGMCTNSAVSDWLWGNAPLTSWVSFEYCRQKNLLFMAGFNKYFFPRKCHFMYRNFTVIFMY